MASALEHACFAWTAPTRGPGGSGSFKARNCDLSNVHGAMDEAPLRCLRVWQQQTTQREE